MKNKHKFLALLLAVTLCFSMSLVVSAAEADATDDVVVIDANEVMPLGSGTYYIGATNAFVEVASYSGGAWTFSFDVANFDPGSYQVDIIMAGNSGTVWQEDDCLGKDYTARTFSCGSDVKRIYLRIIPRNKLFPAPAKNFTVNVYYVPK